jgi:hypothetical protein
MILAVPEQDMDDFEATWRAFKRTPPEVAKRKREELARRKAEIERDIIILDQIIERGSTGVDPPLSTATPRASGSLRLSVNGDPPKPTKPKGLLMVMAEDTDHAWKLSQVRDVMVERGWLQPGEKGTHQIQTTASTLKKRGQLVSAGHGHYRITPAGLEAARR